MNCPTSIQKRPRLVLPSDFLPHPDVEDLQLRSDVTMTNRHTLPTTLSRRMPCLVVFQGHPRPVLSEEAGSNTNYSSASPRPRPHQHVGCTAKTESDSGDIGSPQQHRRAALAVDGSEAISAPQDFKCKHQYRQPAQDVAGATQAWNAW